MKYKIILYAFALISFSCNEAKKNNDKPQKIAVKKIWDKAPYNAFTDLIRFKGKFYCVFREGTGHVPGKSGNDGQIRVLISESGKKWTSVALLSKEGIDLRDPKISVTPDGRLMIICGGSDYKGGSLLGRYPQVIFSDTSGTNFSSPEKAYIDPKIISWGDWSKDWRGDWIWRVTWHNDTGYGIDYQIGPKHRSQGGKSRILLVSTKDGKNYNLVHKFHINGYPNESTIRFDKKGKMYILIRRELEDKMGILATSNPPYANWTFHKLTARLGGPNFIFLNDSQLILGSRTYKKKNDTMIYHTGIMLTDLTGKIDTTIILPSGNDTGYPGLLIYNDTLWTTYYSNHKNNHTSIYLAKIPLSLFENVE